MGSLGYCEVCGGENCTRGSDVCCINCGRPRDAKQEPKLELDELLAEETARMRKKAKAQRQAEPALVSVADEPIEPTAAATTRRRR